MIVQPQFDHSALTERYALVADDDATMRDILYALLTEAAYTVILAESGRHAINLASNFYASIAFLDLAMPNGNGLQTCAALRKMPNWHNVPIIILTHYSIDNALNAALRAGASGFLCKPLVPTELSWCLETHADKIATAERPQPVVARLDPARVAELANMAEELLPPSESDWKLELSSADLVDEPPAVSDVRSPLIIIGADEADPGVVTRDGRPRILVGEDDLVAREIICLALNSAGCVAEHAQDGHELLSMLIRRHYDMVLMNMIMPVAGAIDVARSIRALPGPKGSTPIIAMAHTIEYPSIRHLNDAGISGHLVKPLSAELLRRCLRRHLPVEAPDPTVLKSANVEHIPDITGFRTVAMLFPSGVMVGLLSRLVTSVQEVLLMLDDCHVVPVPQDLARRLHNLAGTAGTLGCGVLSVAARGLEADHSGSKQARLQFVKAANAAITAIGAYIFDERPPPPATVPTGILRVLVVDDFALNREIAECFLRAAGHQVTCVEGGAEAIAAVTMGHFDVIMMDVRMPEMDGLEATRRIRALQGAGASVPIVAMTAQTSSEQIAQCRSAGMNSHLGKPFEPDTLLDAILRATLPGNSDAGRTLGCNRKRVSDAALEMGPMSESAS